MSESKSKSKNNQKKTKEARRLWILQKLYTHSIVATSDIESKFVCQPKTITDDIIYFKKHMSLNLTRIHADPNDKRRTFLANEALLGYGIIERLSHFAEEKAVIAEMACNLITGVQAGMVLSADMIRSNLKITEPEIKSEIHDNPNYDGQVEYNALQAKIHTLANKFAILWRQHNRDAIIDAGTTNLKLAKLLSDTSYPVGELNRLTIMTNYTPIFQLLASFESPVSGRIVGGMQIGDTNAIAGFESIAFLKNLPSLTCGIAILGATSISANRFAAYASSHQEAELKSLFLERSVIKVIVVDDSKFAFDVMRTSRAYADLSNVDLIITNEPADKTINRQHGGASDFNQIVSTIRRKGTPVLVVPLPEDPDKALDQ